ncbi:MAG TPA: KH domain-containing protein [Kamptonema sp.]|nr:KH domain-containing protein [Kamptonema sp.]
MQRSPASPDYVGLVRFLIEPFLESPESLRVDCELHPRQARTWIRLAFDEPDKGRVYGRGGRNIQAIRTVLEMVAKTVSQSVYLDIYDAQGEEPRYSNPRSDSRYGSSRDRDSRPRGRDIGSRPSKEPRRSTPPPFRPSRSNPDFG